MADVKTPAPLRAELPPEVEKAARMIHRRVWRSAYRHGEGPMHFAGGSFWHDALLDLADLWEKEAKAARICAQFLPNEESA